MGTGGRAGGGGGAGAGAVVPEQGMNSGTIGNMSPNEIRGLSREVQATEFGKGSSLRGDARGDELRKVNASNLNRPTDGRYVASNAEYSNFMRAHGTAMGAQAERDADRLSLKRDGSVAGDRAYLRDTTAFANRMTQTPTTRNIRRLGRVANAMEDINSHDGAHILRTRGALATTQLKFGRKTK